MKNVLLVGPCYADSKSLREFLESRFEVSIIEANNLEEAKNLLKQREIGVIITTRTIASDKKQGIQLLDFVKKNYLGTPVIVLTRFVESQKEALSKGAAASFDMDLLIGCIRPSMEQKHKAVLLAIEKLFID